MKTYLFPLLIILLFCLSCSSKKKENPPPPPVNVTEYTIEPKNIPKTFDFIGFAESSHSVEIRARVEGYLDSINYNEGGVVQAGQLMFQLDPREYQTQVAQAKANVAREAALYENANLTVNRLRPLYEQKAASKKDLDNAIANQLASSAALEEFQAKLREAEINLGYTTIVSPVTGLADRSKLREGALINPGSNSKLTTVSVLDPIWVYFTVSDNDILRAKMSEKEKTLILPESGDYEVEIDLGSGFKFPFRGKVNFSSPTYDQSTGSLLIRAVFPNPVNEILPGEFVRVTLYGAELPNAIAVPQRALLQKKNGMFVYLIDENSKVVAQDVSTGSWSGDYQIITNGLKAGDRIVVDGINKVIPGSVVKVIGEWKPSVDASAESETQ